VSFNARLTASFNTADGSMNTVTPHGEFTGMWMGVWMFFIFIFVVSLTHGIHLTFNFEILDGDPFSSAELHVTDM